MRRRPEQVPAENTDWFNYGGIFRDIDLIPVPDSFIRSFRLGLVPDGSFGKLQLNVSASAPGETECVLEIPELGVRETIPVREGRGEALISYIRGMSPWLLYDFRSPRRTSAAEKYYNRKGLLDETKKRKKSAFFVLQRYYREKI